MKIRISDWCFEVDLESTFDHTLENSRDHCECAYCRNFYDCVDMIYPNVRTFLAQFGVVLDGPSELMPFEPTLILACYRVQGSVLKWGNSPIYVDGMHVTIEASEGNTFFIWLGEMTFPWCQSELIDEVISPANDLDFMERMRQIWCLRHEEKFVFS